MKEITKACIAGAIIGASLFAVAKHANAEIVMYTQNESDGTIQFSNLRGECQKGWLAAVVVDKSGTPVESGCWYYDEPNVVTQWTGGPLRYYNPLSFNLTKAFGK